MLLSQVRKRDSCPGMKSSFALCFDGRFSEELTLAGASVEWLGEVRIRDPLSIRRARQNLKKLLQRGSFDLVLTHSFWSQAIFGPTVRRQRLPLGLYLHAQPDGRHWLERWARRTLPDFALCNSHFTAATLPQLYPRVPFEVVYCPVAPPEQRYSTIDRNRTRAELGTSQDATVIVQVSRLEPGKGHAAHLEALSSLKDLPGWVCWQVGGAQTPREEKYLQELKETASRLGISDRVQFLEHRTDIARLLAAANIFCQPNTGSESFGITFIEALYAGLPVVTTDIGGAREIVNDSCGIRVPQGDPTALASSLRLLIQNPALRDTLGAAGPERADQLCNPTTQMGRLNRFLTSKAFLKRGPSMETS
jgi:glycosyltransferase involved in cell wall biosynthesis